MFKLFYFVHLSNLGAHTISTSIGTNGRRHAQCLEKHPVPVRQYKTNTTVQKKGSF